MSNLVVAKKLTLASTHSTVFGPLSLEIPAGALCFIAGENASGKSALLLALSGRMQGLDGSLRLCGIDALKHPRRAIEKTSVAQIGNYVAVEDRLTVAEAVADRAYLDDIPLGEAKKRFAYFEELVGFTLNADAQLAAYDLVTQRWLSVVLACLRPASVVVLDDADLGLTPAQAAQLYSILTVISEAEEAAVIVSGQHVNAVPAGTLLLKLASPKLHPTAFEDAHDGDLEELNDQEDLADPLAELVENEVASVTEVEELDK